MIYLELFLTFLQIGAFSFGGGYGMISLIREKVMSYGWLTEEELLNMIAVAESTPGPIAVNMATFVGSSQGGFFGALLATLGVVLPSFIIILIIAALIRNLLKFAGVKAFLGGIRPCVVGLILATAITMFMNTAIGFSGIGDTVNADLKGIIIFGILIAIGVGAKIIFKKKPHLPEPRYCDRYQRLQAGQPASECKGRQDRFHRCDRFQEHHQADQQLCQEDQCDRRRSRVIQKKGRRLYSPSFFAVCTRAG